MKNLLSNKGAIGLETLFTVVGMVTLAVATFYTTTNSTDNKIADSKLEFRTALASTDSNVAVEKTRTDSLEARMDRFDAKMDKLLEKSNIDPLPINARFPLAIPQPTATTSSS